MILTRENIHQAGNCGGFNSAQLTLLGAENSKHGWLRKLVGKEISDDDYQKLIELRGATKQKQIEIVPERKSFFISSARKPDGTELARKKLLNDIRSQVKNMLLSLKAGEGLSAQDHARRILEILKS